MTSSLIYLDHNATSPMTMAAQEAYIEAARCFGNPSSIHQSGRQARNYLENAREIFAQTLGVPSAQLIFTSGATESNNLALKGAYPSSLSMEEITPHLILLSPAAHPSVTFLLEEKSPYRQAKLLCIDPLEGGIDPQNLEENLLQCQKEAPHTPIIVSLPLADGTSGIIETERQRRRLYKLTRKYNALLHVDAAQAIGRIPFSCQYADLISLTFHKIGGAKGCGLLYVNKETVQLHPQLQGGGQEQRKRSGIQNYPAIWASAVALQERLKQKDLWETSLASYRDSFEKHLMDHLKIEAIGKNYPRLPNTSALFIPQKEANQLVISFDLKGIMVSAGSACHSGRMHPPLGFLHRGFSVKQARHILRVSLDIETPKAHTDHFIETLASFLS